MDRVSAVEELKKSFAIMADDVELVRDMGKSANTPFAQRTLLRTHFAFIEGMSFLLRQVALANSEIFTAPELATLREESYALNKKGDIEAKPNFQKPLPLILFTFRSYARIHGAKFNPDTSVHGWECMAKYKAVRDRLTHPKSSDDLSLSDEELRYCMNAAEWFKKTMLDLFACCEEADDYYRKQAAT
ncbi:MAG: hypothetical protein H6969_06570 [Gammaproteobacteria bacterium]|nr:hypothetical protein [Gammaproteobacteria bacterium]MCP5459986.1 hypothetical protein [Gammaproteobacteria bacterium]